MQLEIDVKPFQVADREIYRLIFSNGVPPKGVTIEWNKQFAYARARVYLGQRTLPQVLAVGARDPFKTYFLRHIEGLGVGWEERANHRRSAHDEAFDAAYGELGGHTPNEIIALGQGAYEIPGVGFVWYGSDRKTSGQLTIETQRSVPSVDESIRWFLKRGASLSEARYLNETQQRNLNMQALAAGGIALGSVAGFSVGSASPSMWSKAVKTVKDVASRDLDAAGVKGKSDLFQAIIKKFSTSEAEARIQELNRRPVISIVQLPKMP
jgi:hypothetical protein